MYESNSINYKLYLTTIHRLIDRFQSAITHYIAVLL